MELGQGLLPDLLKKNLQPCAVQLQIALQIVPSNGASISLGNDEFQT
jgi:hypothetical protein